MIADDHQSENAVVTEDQFAEKMKVAYPKVEEDLIDFLDRCKISNAHAMLCPRCSAVFDKEGAKSVEGLRPQAKRKGGWVDNQPKFGFNKRGVPYKMKASEKNPGKSHRKTFNLSSKTPTNTWVFFGGKKSGYSAPPTKWVKRVATTSHQQETSNSNKYAYNNNYKGKNPVTKTQWRRYQRQKKASALKNVTNVEKREEKQETVFEMVERPATERIFPPLPTLKKDLPKEDEEITSNFSESDPSLDIVCNVVSVLPVEYDVPSEVNKWKAISLKKWPFTSHYAIML
jgi:hypothetical protein